MKSLRIEHIRNAAYIWAAFPVVLFLLFWFRWYYALPSAGLFVYASFKVIKSFSVDNFSTSGRITLDYRIFIVLCFVLIWLLAIGVGGIFGQETHDNGYRNAVLYELTYSSWPVVNSDFVGGAYISYYFAYWLPAALVGKCFGSYDASQAMLMIYSYVGLVLLALMVMHSCRRRYLLVGILVFLISGLDYMNTLIFSNLLGWHRFISVGSLVFGAPTLPYLGTYIYNQGFPAWIILMLMYSVRNRVEILMLLYVPLLLMAPFAAIVIAPILGVALLCKVKKAISSINLIGILTCLLVAIFLAANKNGGEITVIFNDGIPLWQLGLMAIGWMLFNFGVFVPFVWTRIKRDSLFWALVAITLLISMIRPGYGNYDFGWKSPMVITGYFYLQVIDYCSRADWKQTRNIILAMMLASAVLLNETSGMRIAKRAYHFVILQDDADCLKRADWLVGKLFDPAANYCYDSFVASQPSLYSKYFAPRSISAFY